MAYSDWAVEPTHSGLFNPKAGVLAEFYVLWTIESDASDDPDPSVVAVKARLDLCLQIVETKILKGTTHTVLAGLKTDVTWHETANIQPSAIEDNVNYTAQLDGIRNYLASEMFTGTALVQSTFDTVFSNDYMPGFSTDIYNHAGNTTDAALENLSLRLQNVSVGISNL